MKKRLHKGHVLLHPPPRVLSYATPQEAHPVVRFSTCCFAHFPITPETWLLHTWQVRKVMRKHMLSASKRRYGTLRPCSRCSAASSMSRSRLHSVTEYASIISVGAPCKFSDAFVGFSLVSLCVASRLGSVCRADPFSAPCCSSLGPWLLISVLICSLVVAVLLLNNACSQHQ